MVTASPRAKLSRTFSHLSRPQQRSLGLGRLHRLQEGWSVDDETAREGGLHHSRFVLFEPVPFLYARRQEICNRKRKTSSKGRVENDDAVCQILHFSLFSTCVEGHWIYFHRHELNRCRQRSGTLSTAVEVVSEVEATREGCIISLCWLRHMTTSGTERTGGVTSIRPSLYVSRSNNTVCYKKLLINSY